MKMHRRLFNALVFTVLLIVFSVQYLTVSAIVDDEDVTLKILYTCDDVKIPDAEFKIYYVADIDKSCNFTPAGDFSNYPIDFDCGSDQYQYLAQTIYGYILLDNLAPMEIGTTNSEGELVFSTTENSLKQGVYLVVADDKIFGDYKYTVEPYLLSLPYFNSDTKSFEYSIVSYPKCERIRSSDSDTDSDGSVSRSVLKRWEDEGFENERPDAVEVSLLKNGTVYDTVELNEENNWYYSWENLNESSDWLVVERPVDNYTALVTSEGTVFVVTNTRNGADSDTDSDSDTDFPPSTDTSSPPVTSTPNGSTPTLPQTGTLWWLVPILLAIGLAFFILGCVIRRGTGRDE